MKISSPFNRLYHSLLNQAYHKARQISFREWKCDQTGGCLIFYKHEDYEDMLDLKEIFKLMNIDYEVDGDKKLSTTLVDNKQLVRHIEFITKILAENGVSFSYNDELWGRILMEAGIEK